MNPASKQNFFSEQARNSSRGAVLVELTYVIVIMILLATSTLELVNFMRHHKMAMSLSFEVANQIFKECPDVTRNLLEENSYNRQRLSGTTPANIEHCVLRNTNQFQGFLAAYAGTAATLTACPQAGDLIEEDATLPPYAYVEISNPTTRPGNGPHQSLVIQSGGVDLRSCIAAYERSLATGPGYATYNGLITAGGGNPSVVVRSVVFIPYRGILFGSDFFKQLFSSDNFMRNGGVRAQTII